MESAQSGAFPRSPSPIKPITAAYFPTTHREENPIMVNSASPNIRPPYPQVRESVMHDPRFNGPYQNVSQRILQASMMQCQASQPNAARLPEDSLTQRPGNQFFYSPAFQLAKPIVPTPAVPIARPVQPIVSVPGAHTARSVLRATQVVMPITPIPENGPVSPMRVFAALPQGYIPGADRQGMALQRVQSFVPSGAPGMALQRVQSFVPCGAPYRPPTLMPRASTFISQSPVLHQRQPQAIPRAATFMAQSLAPDKRYPAPLRQRVGSFAPSPQMVQRSVPSSTPVIPGISSFVSPQSIHMMRSYTNSNHYSVNVGDDISHEMRLEEMRKAVQQA